MSDEFRLFYKCYFTERKLLSNWVTPYPELIKALKGEELETARTMLWEKMIHYHDEGNYNLMNPYIKVVACDGDKRAIPILKELYKKYKSKHGKKFSKSELENLRIVVVGAHSEDDKRKTRELAMKSHRDYTYTLRECLDALYTLEHKKIYLFKKIFLFR